MGNQLTKYARITGGIGLLLASVAVQGSCTLISDLSGDQCEVDEDCSGRGAAFSNTVCSPQKICVAAGSQGCSSNQECIDQNNGQPFICRNPGVGEQCVSLLSEHCLRVVGDVSDDNVLIFGWMFPMTGELAFLTDLSLPPVELALNEIATNGGIPVGTSGSRRPMAVVACDELIDPQEAARHLIEDIGVPTIHGPGLAGGAIDVLQSLAIDNDTLLFPPGHCATIEETIPDNGLLWSVYPSGSVQADTIVKIVESLEPRIRTEQGLTADEPIRVAMTVRGDPETTGLADYLVANLVFNTDRNGEPLTALDNGDNFFRVDYPDTDAEPVDFSDEINQLLQHDPHIIIPLGFVESTTGILELTEQNWETEFRPYYVFNDGGFAPDVLQAAVNARPDLRTRAVGTLPYADYESDAWKAYNIRFKALFGIDAIVAAEFWYDATYLTAYAAVAAPPGELDGAALAQGLRKTGNELNPDEGTLVNAGPTDMNKAFGALAAGGTINYQGVTVPADFNHDTGCARSDYVVWCISLDENGGAVLDPSGRYAKYDYETDALVGLTPEDPPGLTCD